MGIVKSRELDCGHLKSETVGTKEAAELLKIHPHSVEKLLREGKIAAAKIVSQNEDDVRRLKLRATRYRLGRGRADRCAKVPPGNYHSSECI